MTTTPTTKGSLALSRGRINRPQKAVICGPEGVGKSTFASLTPQPVFLDTEGGTHHLDVTRLDAATTWDEITAAVAQLAKADHPFKTLVIDTADWLEKRLSEHLCRKAKPRMERRVESIVRDPAFRRRRAKLRAVACRPPWQEASAGNCGFCIFQINFLDMDGDMPSVPPNKEEK